MINTRTALPLLFVISALTANAASLPTGVQPILDEKALDKTINPCENFYQFSCGGWMNSIELPEDKTAYFRQWSGMEDETEKKLNAILEAFAKGDTSLAKSKYAVKLGDYYQSCMNTTESPQASTQLLLAKLIEINKIKNMRSLAAEVADLHLLGVNLFFGFSPGQDFTDSSKVVAMASQGGLSLPEREYYFKTDEKSVETRQKFVEHVAAQFRTVGYRRGNALKAAQFILQFETQLASAAATMEEKRDPNAMNHPMTVSGFSKLSPSFDWSTYLSHLGVANLSELNATEPKFYKNFEAILRITPLSALKTYMKWQMILRSAPSMTSSFETENFNFWEAFLQGKKSMSPRWKKCTRLVGEALRDGLAEAFVSASNGEAARTKTALLIDAVKKSFLENLAGLTWLDDETRKAAVEKLATLNQKLAFPDHWKTYDGLAVSSMNLLSNTFASAKLESAKLLSEIGKPVDHGKWYMPAWEVNAYYDPSNNEFVFPLGILQPPVLDLNASDGANMGALGATIGHELTHGYDDEGSQFDGRGNLRDWWPAPVRAEFTKNAQCYASQASKYEALPGLFINGATTLGENLADQGGTKLAYRAFKTMSAGRPEAPVFAGQYNETQQFFISYAQSWCGKLRPEKLRSQLQTDVHPPVDYRVNGVVVNMPEFADAFACTVGQKMAPAERCSLW